MNVIATDAQQELVDIHKQGNTSFVAPVLVTNITVAVALSYQWQWEYLVAVLLTLVAFIFNVSFVLLNPKIGKLRNDRNDALRWGINLIAIDVPVAIFLKSHFMIVAGFWLIVVIGAFIEIYERKLRYAMTALALICALASLSYAYPEAPFVNLIMFASTAICILALIVAIESNWMKQSNLHTLAQRRENELLNQSQELYKSSLTGDNARLIAHEVDNMITAINFATDNPKDIDVKSIKLSLGYVKNACDLILREQRNKVHQNSIDQLIKDINLLIRKQAEGQGIEWTIQAEAGSEAYIFKEREGSSYFIIQNFVKNAVRSIKSAQQKRGKILIDIRKERSFVAVSVHDNGTGIDESIKQKLLSGKGKDVETRNHGIGSQFVHRECQLNAFEFIVEDSILEDFKAKVGIRIPAIHGI